MLTIRRAWTVAALCALAIAALVGAVAWAGDPEDKPEVREERKVRIVTTDEEGNTNEQVFELGPGAPLPFLGVVVGRADDEGVVVADVVEGSGAERAGLREGDVIVSVDGEPLEAPWDLTVRIMRAKPGDLIDLGIRRDGEPMTLTAEVGKHEGPGLLALPDLERLQEHLGQLEQHLGDLDLDMDMPHFRHFDFRFAGRPKLGVQLVQPTSELREHLGAPRDAGVLVGKVLAGTPAEDAGVRVGDVIVSVDGERVKDAGDLIGALRDKDGSTIQLELVRDRATMTIDVTIPEADEESYGPEVRWGPDRPKLRPAPPLLRG